MPIPFEQIENIHKEYKTDNLMSLRESTWSSFQVMVDEIEEAKELAKTTFEYIAKELKAKKHICYYVNEAMALCRGTVNSWDTLGGEYKVRFDDLDNPTSAFNKDYISWYHVYKIGDPIPNQKDVFEIYYLNMGFFAEETFETLDHAKEVAKSKGFEMTIYKNKTLIGSMSPINGYSSLEK